MTSFAAPGAARRAAPGGAGARLLRDDELPAVLAVAALDPVASVLATTRVQSAVRSGQRRSGGEAWGYELDGRLVAACWAGANLVPLVPPEVCADPALHGEVLDAFARIGRARGRRCTSLVGESSSVLGLWQRLAEDWGPAREVRADQPSMVIDHDPVVASDPQVRRSVPADYPQVLPACVQMFVEEVGYSPVGVGSAYESRVRSLIADGRSFVRMDPVADGPAEVVFKAELGAVAGGIAQVQGVWVTPARRGQGLSESGMAAVVTAARRDVAPVVSLYVNHYNTRALATYRAVGFRQVGTYATVLL